jgi:hypothetical protein
MDHLDDALHDGTSGAVTGQLRDNAVDFAWCDTAIPSHKSMT